MDGSVAGRLDPNVIDNNFIIHPQSLISMDTTGFDHLSLAPVATLFEDN